MIRPPPRSTLFPSTTLFRSVGQDDLPIRERRLVDVEHQDGTAGPGRPPGEPPGCLGGDGREVARVGAGVDRKSTRLNSSHANISYAVFCLIKSRHANIALTH